MSYCCRPEGVSKRTQLLRKPFQAELERSMTVQGKQTPGTELHKAESPGVAGVVVCGVELSELLPREVWDAQGVPSGDH